MIPQQRWATGGSPAPRRMSPLTLTLCLLARAGVGGVLIYSGASKALAPSAEFAAALAAYRILPTGLIPTIAQVWPWLELLVGTYVFFGYFTRVFAGVSAGMFAVFLAVLGSAALRGINPGACGCFGLGMSMSPHKMLAIDTVLWTLSLLLAILNKKPTPYSADSWIESK